MKRLRTAGLLFLAFFGASTADAATYRESPILEARVKSGDLPPVTERLPKRPATATMDRPDQIEGIYGDEIRLLMARAKDVRLMVAYGYSRLVKYDHRLNLVVDLLHRISVEDGRIFTLHLRPGHKWSDGTPFTTEDFRYYWEDIANNQELSPLGPPKALKGDGWPPEVTIIDAHTIRFVWPKPNPDFLPSLARTRPYFIYRPAHYLKRFHAKYADRAALDAAAKKAGFRNWAGRHNRLDNPYKFDNPERPTLQPWINTTALPAERFIFKRNPFYHRVDASGRQLPYIDRIVMTIANKRLIPAKAGAGEADLQARYLRFDNFVFLKENAERSKYRVRTWQVGKGAHMALFPNLNANDPAWRKLMRDVRFRRALSLAINRRELNKALFYGLGLAAQNTVLPQSALYREDYRKAWTSFDVEAANRLLDTIGLTERTENGLRRLPDGRPAVIIIETAGENTEEPDVLQLIRDSWQRIGIDLLVKPSHRDVLRNRIYAGETVMSISWGLENGLPGPDSNPAELAPTRQIQYQWPKWGQYVETGGQVGKVTDMPSARRLSELLAEWRAALTRKIRRRVWHEMLSIHADQLFSIGLISGTLQPIVVNRRLRNVPKEGIYSWQPGAHFGLYEPDTFWMVPIGGSL